MIRLYYNTNVWQSKSNSSSDMKRGPNEKKARYRAGLGKRKGKGKGRKGGGR